MVRNDGPSLPRSHPFEQLTGPGSGVVHGGPFGHCRRVGAKYAGVQCLARCQLDAPRPREPAGQPHACAGPGDPGGVLALSPPSGTTTGTQPFESALISVPWPPWQITASHAGIVFE